MNDIQIFNNPKFGEIRTITENGEILFCGKDVAVALGYKDPVNALKQHCRGVVKRHLTDSLGRDQATNFIPEGDLYRLTAGSELPEAKKFESWIFDEVLPTLRKTGTYTVNEDKAAARVLREKTAQLNCTARIVQGLVPQMEKAGIDPKYQLLVTAKLYEGSGLVLPLPDLEVPEKTYGVGEIAKELGVLSVSKEPHKQAVAAILKELDINPALTIRTPYINGGHAGDSLRYKERVVRMVQSWLDCQGWPKTLHAAGKNYNVVYGEVK